MLVLSFLSFVVVLKGAGDEPYFVYRHSDAFTQIVIGTSLFTMWGCFAVFLAVSIFAKHLSKKWIAGIVWAVVCMFYLSCCPAGYLHDLEQFILPNRAVTNYFAN
jgi:hypothetical protein